MTFEEFLATKKWSDHLSKDIDFWQYDGEPIAKGNIYLGQLFIERVGEHWPEPARRAGTWHLMLGRDEYITVNLEELEHRLFDFAVSEGYCTQTELDAECARNGHRDDGRGFCAHCGNVI
jgi:hypothetical protein